MKFFRLLYSTFLDALFPRPTAEREVFSYTPKEALAKLPKAPKFTEEYENMHAIFAYKDERVSRLVWAIKYKRMEVAVKIGGYALLQELEKSDSIHTIIIPMPVTERRRRERGYKQCELLLEETKSLYENNPLNGATVAKFIFENKLLVRTHHDSYHKLKDRADRLEDAKGIFSIDQNVLAKLSGDNPDMLNTQVIIIDDVITTGSTMREAAKTLHAAGFMSIQGLALAH